MLNVYAGHPDIEDRGNGAYLVVGRYCVVEVGSLWDVYDLNVSDDQRINERGYATADAAIAFVLGGHRP